MYRDHLNIEGSDKEKCDSFPPPKYNTGDIVFQKISTLDNEKIKHIYKIYNGKVSQETIIRYILPNYDGNEIIIARYNINNYCAVRTSYIGYIQKSTLHHSSDNTTTYSINWEARNPQTVLPGLPMVFQASQNDELLIGLLEMSIVSAEEMLAQLNDEGK